ncbi:MAG TPA: tRNA (adenosine(37)-N6)-dimethylallyltransferase MiaA [Bacteroidales bacterium]|nr:tRNA (adenosine(37)-N6)-dimethylallyltransferase MiaA [Bacteroidales bacterium]
MSQPLITILGPTASGKTHLAVKLASKLHAEIISGDSRQVYRGMDIGTGKDLNEYTLDGQSIPFHLIDIVDAGYKYNVFEYQQDFLKVWKELKQPAILCGGTGLYIESILRGYRLVPVPANPVLREELERKSLDELTKLLATYKKLHNTTDVDTVKRAVRAIEIEEYYLQNPLLDTTFPKIESIVFGLDLDREVRRDRITNRLKARLNEGMVAEVEDLIGRGIPVEDLIYYGLEYKYLSLYIVGELTFDQMFTQLEIAIHQFAKRQMTWFRGMETRGIKIQWLDAMAPAEENIQKMKALINPVG